MSQPLQSFEQLVEYFRSGEKSEDRWRVGTEHEKIGVYADTRERIPYEGERGIGALLDRIAREDGWERILERGNPIALLKDGASITLEPGGQIELSGIPLSNTNETCGEFNRHVDLVKRVGEDLGIAWLGLGADPFHPVSEIPKMPKARYDIMRSYLPSRGAHALDMMHATATVQANLDYRDEADMVSKLRTAMGCTSVVSAIFANSSISEGAANGFISRRMEIWRDVDPDRCGLLHWVYDDDFGYEAYAKWALDVPMFFVIRGHHYIPAKGTTFRRFMAEGFEDECATVEDWDMHLTTLFPEVRLKRFIEVRGADGVPRELICALPAIWKGLLYDERACADAWKLVCSWTREEREEGHSDVARRGLGATIGGQAVSGLAMDLTQIAAEGLRRLSEQGAADERRFLDPIYDQLALGKSPGQVVLERWEGEWQRSPDRLIEYARY